MVQPTKVIRSRTTVPSLAQCCADVIAKNLSAFPPLHFYPLILRNLILDRIPTNIDPFVALSCIDDDLFWKQRLSSGGTFLLDDPTDTPAAATLPSLSPRGRPPAPAAPLQGLAAVAASLKPRRAADRRSATAFATTTTAALSARAADLDSALSPKVIFAELLYSRLLSHPDGDAETPDPNSTSPFPGIRPPAYPYTASPPAPPLPTDFGLAALIDPPPPAPGPHPLSQASADSPAHDSLPPAVIALISRLRPDVRDALLADAGATVGGLRLSGVRAGVAASVIASLPALRSVHIGGTAGAAGALDDAVVLALLRPFVTDDAGGGLAGPYASVVTASGAPRPLTSATLGVGASGAVLATASVSSLPLAARLQSRASAAGGVRAVTAGAVGDHTAAAAARTLATVRAATRGGRAFRVVGSGCTLTTLRLDGVPLRGPAVDALALGLRACVSLRTLALDAAGLDDAAVVALAQAFAPPPVHAPDDDDDDDDDDANDTDAGKSGAHDSDSPRGAARPAPGGALPHLPLGGGAQGGGSKPTSAASRGGGGPRATPRAPSRDADGTVYDPLRPRTSDARVPAALRGVPPSRVGVRSDGKAGRRRGSAVAVVGSAAGGGVSRLLHLSLEANDFGARGALALASTLHCGALPLLQTLSVRMCTGVGDTAAAQLAAAAVLAYAPLTLPRMRAVPRVGTPTVGGDDDAPADLGDAEGGIVASPRESIGVPRASADAASLRAMSARSAHSGFASRDVVSRGALSTSPGLGDASDGLGVHFGRPQRRSMRAIDFSHSGAGSSTLCVCVRAAAAGAVEEVHLGGCRDAAVIDDLYGNKAIKGLPAEAVLLDPSAEAFVSSLPALVSEHSIAAASELVNAPSSAPRLCVLDIRGTAVPPLVCRDVITALAPRVARRSGRARDAVVAAEERHEDKVGLDRATTRRTIEGEMATVTSLATSPPGVLAAMRATDRVAAYFRGEMTVEDAVAAYEEEVAAAKLLAKEAAAAADEYERMRLRRELVAQQESMKAALTGVEPSIMSSSRLV